MQVMQYSTFVDPGIAMLTDLGIAALVESDVDTNILGTYTITYIVTYLEIDYSITRSVEVVSELTISLPILLLAGENSIQVEQYSTYVDEGASIVGPFTMDIVKVSDVDTSILGTYSVVFTISYLGIDYSVTRTVEVVVETTTTLPVLELIGESSIQVEQDSVYVDEGASIVGPFTMDIVEVSDVDTSILGTYSVVFTISYLGIDYSVTRSVEVVEEVVDDTADFFITLTESEVSFTTLTVSLEVLDSDSVISERFIELYEEDTLIESIAFVTGDNSITFSGLKGGTDYTAIVKGEFTYDGYTQNLSGYELELSTLPFGIFSLSLGDLVVSSSTIEFAMDIVDEDDLIIEIMANVYENDVLVESIELSVENYFALFDELEDLTEYELEILVTVVAHDSTVEQVLEFHKIKYITLESIMPTVTSNVCNERYYTLECDADFDFTGFDNLYIYAVIYEGDVVENTEYLASIPYEYVYRYLESGTDYTIKIFADFHHIESDGSYTGILLGSYDVSTKVIGYYAVPIAENVVITRTSTSITVEFDLIDVEDGFNVGYVSIFRGWSTAGAPKRIYVGHNILIFDESIYENELYEVRISADYKGNGTSAELYTKELMTPPEITVDSFIQSEMFFVNDEVIVKIDLDNDEKVDVTAVTIDGIRYDGVSIEFPSDIDTLYVNLGDYTSDGDYSVTLENLIVTLLEEEYEIDVEVSADVDVYIAGSIVPDDAAVIVIDIVPEDYIVAVDSDDTSNRVDVNVSIFLDNPYGLDVTSIKIGGVTYTAGSTLTIVSETELSFVASIGRYYENGVTSSYNLYFGGITFVRNDESILGYNSPAVSVAIIREYDYDSDDTTSSVIMISTPEELQALSTNRTTRTVIYRLQNDIDMSGYAFTPIGQSYSDRFIAIFDGNGFTISNISITGTTASGDENIYFGLFGHMGGSIVDLTLDNVNITLSTESDVYPYVGALAGHQTGSVYNVHVKNSMITIDGVIIGEVGGMFGHQHGTVLNSSADTDIVIVSTTFDASNSRLYIGGFIGLKDYEDIRNSSSSGDISIVFMNYYTIFGGGLIGSIYNSGSGANTQYVSNSYATGDLTITTDGTVELGD